MASFTSALLPALSILLLCVGHSASFFLRDSPQLKQLLSRYREEVNGTGDAAAAGSSRNRRAIRWSDREEILQLHNKLRGGVYPTASNMEHMVRPPSCPHFDLILFAVVQASLHDSPGWRPFGGFIFW